MESKDSPTGLSGLELKQNKPIGSIKYLFQSQVSWLIGQSNIILGVLTYLTELRLSDNSIENITFLRNLKILITLQLNRNKLKIQ
jgi:Leucine-rich repeat (LRR) protein